MRLFWSAVVGLSLVHRSQGVYQEAPLRSHTSIEREEGEMSPDEAKDVRSTRAYHEAYGLGYGSQSTQIRASEQGNSLSQASEKQLAPPIRPPQSNMRAIADRKKRPEGSRMPPLMRQSYVDAILSRPALPFVPALTSKTAGSDIASVSTPTAPKSWRASGEASKERPETSSSTRTGVKRKAVSMRQWDANDELRRGGEERAATKPRLPEVGPTEYVRALLERKWIEKGLGFHLTARKLAEGVAEIKLKNGYPRQIGYFASLKVEEHTKRKEVDGDTASTYREDYQNWAMRFSVKINVLRKKYAEDHHTFENEEEREKAVYRNFRNVEEKEYDRSRRKTAQSAKESEQQFNDRAKEAWKLLMATHGAKFAGKPLTGELIERYSRKISLPPHDSRATSEYIKRYMGKYLRLSQNEFISFTAQRRRWRGKSRREKERSE